MKKVKPIIRNSCIISGKDDLEELYTFKDFPVSVSTTLKPIEEDLVADMSFAISKSSGMLQLKNIIALDDLYQENHNNSIGALWIKHHQEFSKFIKKANPETIFEIGGARGILSDLYMDAYGEIEWNILEPNPNPTENCKAKFIKGFFDENFVPSFEFDMFVHSHVLEHIYHPDKFMESIGQMIEDNKSMCFSIPNMQVMLDKKYTNVINFEHTLFLTEPYVDFLLAKNQLRLVSKEYFGEDHSIFYYVIKDSKVKPIELQASLYEKNKKMFKEWVSYHQEIVDGINKRMKHNERPVFLFGGHFFSQYLIGFGLETQKISAILDNDSQKQNKRLSGSKLQVVSPNILKNIERPIVILKAGVFNSEIKEDILRNINKDTEFWDDFE